MNIRVIPLVLTFAASACAGAYAHGDHDHRVEEHRGPVKPIAGDRLKIVATTSTFASLVRAIAGDAAEVKYVSLPKFNTHFFQPKFSDVRNVQKADLFVQAGLDHELWTDAILEAAGKPDLFRGAERNIQMSKGIRLLDVPEGPLSRVEGDVHIFGNPHIWMSPENARVMTVHLTERLKAFSPENADLFEENSRAFLEKLDRKIPEWKAATAAIKGKKVVSYHRDIAYFADFAGFKAERFYEPKPGIPPSPKDLIELEKYMKENGVKAIIQPVYYSREATEALARRAGGKVFIICQNAGELPGTDDYISLFDYNVKTIAEALK